MGKFLQFYKLATFKLKGGATPRFVARIAAQFVMVSVWQIEFCGCRLRSPFVACHNPIPSASSTKQSPQPQPKADWPIGTGLNVAL